ARRSSDLALLRGQVDRRLDHGLAVQVAGAAATHGLDALLAQAEHLAGLGLGGDADLGLAVERGHAHGIAERCLRDPDRHFAVQVLAVAHEDLGRAHAHPDVQIAGRRARRTSLALAGQADAVAAVDAGRDLHRQDLLLLHPARAAANRARSGEGLAAAMALRARLLHREDAALEPHLAAPVAGVAGVELAILGAGAPAWFALGQGRDLDPALDAGHGLLEVQLHDIADVGAAARSPRSAAAENVAEDVAEDVSHVGITGPRAAAAHAVLERGVPMLVVHAALAAVRQHLV